ncbi:alpha/beta hydrolase fold domain-containing protein [Seonamhaeicola maritimus]|uniref:Alpha/beta hydrolase fold domain-containing protein n=1 Tax=Seonamhaeicola maritimus TaxID=2591822 RepID=A0A5C7GL79_9FLAO|nr:alpha/beta hydrolase fold domain-containing protein [Seonamhaeicola maritimus]TXG39050.1 alpha/beta hydrolase fold domain-containing protein [Seonamhaeicola maritimus]
MKITLRNIKLIVFLLLCCPLVILAQKSHEKEILDAFPNKETIIYKTVDEQELDMTIFYPDAKKITSKNPWMMHVHGGGWAGGSKYNVLKKAFLGTLKSLLDKGIICVTIEYRLARGKSNAYDALVDAKDAARFLLKNAKHFKLHKKKYGVWGGSAGGHLSLLTALGKDSDFLGNHKLTGIAPKFKCVVSYFPATSLVNKDLVPGSLFEKQSSYDRILGDSLSNKPVLAKLLSPTEQLNKKSPPVLLIHGDKDKVLPIINSTYMVEVAKEKRADVELLTIKNAAHSFHGENISPSIQELNDYATQFILTHLK